jgi:beta-N-acetylhexosaminidase
VSLADLKADAGQMLVAGFDGLSLDGAVADALDAGRLGGAILFARNVEEPRQVAALNEQILRCCHGATAPFVAIDQEGGRVQRIKAPATRLPPMALVGATEDARLAVRVGEVIGAELEAMGFNLNFAPCADVWTNPANEVIGDRAFSDNPEWVSRMAGAVMLGLTMSGIIPCAKHFPGHGDTLLDSHHALPTLDHDVERLRRVELRPFEALMRADLPMIMTAHVMIPAIDTRHPATLSENAIGELLRRKLHFGGVVVSDDLEMKAVADRYSIEEMMTLGVRAGVDLYLICHTREKWEEAFETLVLLGEKSSYDRERIALSAGRIRHLKQQYIRPWAPPEDLLAHLGTDAHQQVIAEVRNHPRVREREERDA